MTSTSESTHSHPPLLTRSRTSLGQSTKDLRDLFLHATSSSRRLTVELKKKSSADLLEKDYLHQDIIPCSETTEKDAKLVRQREKIFELMESYLSNKPKDIAQFIVNHIEYTLARSRFNFDDTSAYLATAYSVRDHLIEGWNDTQLYYGNNASKFCIYMSIEYLTGRSLQNAIYNMGLQDPYHSALMILGYELENLYELEQDAALGNGGLGRLAACYLDSMATLNLPAWGYGLRYQYGMFKQSIVNGAQIETPDYWLGAGNPWEIPRLARFYVVRFYGYTNCIVNSNGLYKCVWEGGEIVHAHAYDNPIPGYRTRNVTNLRLWESKPATEMNLSSFNEGDYDSALAAKQVAEQITSVLYPNDDTYQGKVLRLKQQYFFASATLQDIVDRYKIIRPNGNILTFNDFVAIQLNDTHPTISIPELMRILVDIENIGWDDAWNVTTKVFSYTNHTVLPEAMERWNIGIVSNLLPRHMEIIYEINHRFMMLLEERYPGDHSKKTRLSIIQEGDTKSIRMTHLAIIGSHKVNGVAKIHSDILKEKLFAEFAELWPHKFINITNGVTPRRWINQANPHLSDLISDTIGNDQWLTHLDGLQKLKEYANNPEFQEKWWNIRIENKAHLCDYVSHHNNLILHPDALFDVQIKRIHEYKRQLMNALAIIHRYLWLKDLSPEERSHQVRRVFMFGGKAAPGYYKAKLIIKLISNVASVINNDDEINPYLQVTFLSNYNVSLAELIVSSVDVSQHISTAGTEASGTSNMKFAMNGCLMLGTWDGANIEIAESIGLENMFVFGATEDQIPNIRSSSMTIDGRLWRVLHAISNGQFGNASEFSHLIDPIYHHYDYYVIAHDFPAYLKAQEEIDSVWKDRHEWIRRSILTCSGMGRFSSDRAIRQYASEIWDVNPCPLPIQAENLTVNTPV